MNRNFFEDHLNMSFSIEECKILLKVLQNEWDRWNVLINLNWASGGNPSIAADYEYDSIVIDDLILDFLGAVTRSKTPSTQFYFDYREAAFLIAALDHELDAHNEKELNCEIAISKKLKEMACEKFGDGALTLGHYERGKT